MKYITTHEELKKLDGIKVTCEIEYIPIDDAKIRVEEYKIFICQNIKKGDEADDKLGYKYSWCISDNRSHYDNNMNRFCEKIAFAEKTLDNLEVGDILISNKGEYRKILGIAGEVFFLSVNTRDLKSHYLNSYDNGWSIKNIKNPNTHLSVYIPEEEKTPETIIIGGVKYDKDEVEEKLKDLKPIS